MNQVFAVLGSWVTACRSSSTGPPASDSGNTLTVSPWTKALSKPPGKVGHWSGRLFGAASINPRMTLPALPPFFATSVFPPIHLILALSTWFVTGTPRSAPFLFPRGRRVSSSGRVFGSV
jgi:hypothetical protein